MFQLWWGSVRNCRHSLVHTRTPVLLYSVLCCTPRQWRVKCARLCDVTQTWMSVLLITEAAVHTLPAPTHLEALPVPVLKDMMATDFAAKVTMHQDLFSFLQGVSIASYAEPSNTYDLVVRPSVCPSVCHTLALYKKSTQARITKSSPTDSPRTPVFAIKSSPRNSKEFTPSESVE